MKRILLVDSICASGSVGKICVRIAQVMEQRGYECKIAYGRDGYIPKEVEKYAIRIGSKWDNYLHAIETRLFDNHGLASVEATKIFLKWADEYNPDVLWLHNIHGYYLNYELLFKWIKSRPDMFVRWTLHDCWTFTGHCAYFTHAKCNKWLTGCNQCPQLKSYPASYWLDNCSNNYERKRTAFTGVKNLEIVCPSQWLADLVKLSFLKEYKVIVRHNEIDTSVFKPTDSDFRQKYGCEDKRIILGVANVWDERKGLADFIELRKVLDDEYLIVLVGLSPKQIKQLPIGMLGIQRTVDQVELAQIYTAADVFFNPSREETFGLTTLEAAACGTVPVVYDCTASTEVAQKISGIIVQEGDIDGVKKVIGEVCNGKVVMINKFPKTGGGYRRNFVTHTLSHRRAA